MASSRKTEKYGLSQFDTIDDPSWYTDYNQDMQILDGNAMSKTEYDPLGAISEAGGIKPAIDAASAACAAALKTHVDDKANPHGVTAAQTGAYTRGKVDELLARKTDKTDFNAHTADTANPHGVTAAQTGAYSKAEADGLLSGKAAAADLSAHTGDKANPHSVTAAQAGAYSKAEADALLGGKAAVADLTAHTADTANPHSVTAAQAGAYTKAEADGLLCNKANAADLAALAGKTMDKNQYDSTDAVKLAGGIPAYVAGLLGQIESLTMQKMFPVGSIYSSFNSQNPAAYLGFGTWAPCFVGKSPVGVQTTDAEFNASGKTGGAKTVALTAATLPSHAHGIPELAGSVGYSGDHAHNVSGTIGTGGEHSHIYEYPGADWVGVPASPVASMVQGRATPWPTTVAGNHNHTFSGTALGIGGHTHACSTAASNTYSAGSGSAHNNMHPYETAYFWKRTA